MGRKRKLENRDRILDGATGLLREGVYRDLTVDALARRIQMSKSTLYKYYRDKDHLVDAVVVQAARPLEEVFVQDSADRPLDGLRHVLRAWEAFADQCPAPLLLERDRLPPTASARVEGLFQRLADVLAAGVGNAADRGLLCVDRDLARIALVATAQAGALERARGGAIGTVGLVDLVAV